jgi:Flp pilus assembly protein protease CpaA
MQKLIADLKTLISSNWIVILIIAIMVCLIFSYSDIKQGIMDSWFGR